MVKSMNLATEWQAISVASDIKWRCTEKRKEFSCCWGARLPKSHRERRAGWDWKLDPGVLALQECLERQGSYVQTWLLGCQVVTVVCAPCYCSPSRNKGARWHWVPEGLTGFPEKSHVETMTATIQNTKFSGFFFFFKYDDKNKNPSLLRTYYMPALYEVLHILSHLTLTSTIQSYYLYFIN